MSAPAKTASPLDEALALFGPLSLVLLLGVAVLLAAFQEESRAALQVWIDSTAYGHCFFVVPIAAFLAWERRVDAAAAPVRPLPWLALAAIPLGLVWFAASRLGLMEGQQLVAMTGLQLLFLTVLGWRRYWALSVPLLYLYFLVPFGAFVTPALQDFTAAFIRIGLDLFGISNFSDGMTITIPEGSFFVAEACAGLRFLIASVAFGVLYACMIYRSHTRRAAFIVASIVIPIVANGFRGLGIVVLGHLLGSAEAAAVDHVLYGWLFFSLVILMLIGAGLPFRQDDPNRAQPAPSLSTTPLRRVIQATALAAILGALIPVASAVAIRTSMPAPTPAQTASLGGIVGCIPAQGGPKAGDSALIWRLSCPMLIGPIDHIEMQIALLSAHASPGSILRLRRDASQELSAEDVTAHSFIDRPDATWTVVETTEPDRETVYAAWIDGSPAQGGWHQRVHTALSGLNPTSRLPVVVTLSLPEDIVHLTPSQRHQVEGAMAGVISHNLSLPSLLQAISARP